MAMISISSSSKHLVRMTEIIGDIEYILAKLDAIHVYVWMQLKPKQVTQKSLFMEMYLDTKITENKA